MPFTNKIIDGGEILLYVDGVVVGCSTTHTIETSNATREVSCKGSGDWTSVEYGKFSWSGTTDALFNLHEDANYVRYKDLWELYISKTVITISSEYTEGGETFIQQGDAVIASINQTAGDSENASYSVSFTGRGELGIVGMDLWNINVTATGATHIVIEELNKCVPYSGTGILSIPVIDGTYNVTAFDDTQHGRSLAPVVVSGADESVSITLA